MNERHDALARPAWLRMLAAARCYVALSPNNFGQTCYFFVLLLGLSWANIRLWPTNKLRACRLTHTQTQLPLTSLKGTVS